MSLVLLIVDIFCCSTFYEPLGLGTREARNRVVVALVLLHRMLNHLTDYMPSRSRFRCFNSKGKSQRLLPLLELNLGFHRYKMRQTSPRMMYVLIKQHGAVRGVHCT